eukprot:3748233-Pyramimonas_sp.AAC.1
MGVDHPREAALRFKEKTAVGQVGVAPEAEWPLSDIGMFVLSALFSQREKLGEWPTSRLHAVSVRLPQESGVTTGQSEACGSERVDRKRGRGQPLGRKRRWQDVASGGLPPQVDGGDR